MSRTSMLPKKVAIITGSSSGIGQALAAQLAKTGYALTIHGRNAARLQKTTEMCLEAGCTQDDIVIVTGDLTDEEVLKNIAETTVSKFGRIDVLINNAGIGLYPDKAQILPDSKKIDAVYQINLKAPILLSDHVIPALKKTKGSIINVSSLAASNHALFVYGMFKAALEHMTKTTAMELAPHGVRVNALGLGMILTPMSEPTQGSEEINNTIKDYLTNYMHPMRRLVSQEDINNAVMFLLSERSCFITGAVMPISGGAQLPFHPRVLAYREQIKIMQETGKKPMMLELMESFSNVY